VLEGEAHAPSKHADDLTERVLRFVFVRTCFFSVSRRLSSKLGLAMLKLWSR